MSDESDTDILKKENPLLFAALSFAFRRLETFGLAALAYYMAHTAEHKDLQAVSTTESNDVKTVWQHSGIWTSNIEQIKLKEEVHSSQLPEPIDRMMPTFTPLNTFDTNQWLKIVQVTSQ